MSDGWLGTGLEERTCCVFVIELGCQGGEVGGIFGGSCEQEGGIKGYTTNGLAQKVGATDNFTVGSQA